MSDLSVADRTLGVLLGLGDLAEHRDVCHGYIAGCVSCEPCRDRAEQAEAVDTVDALPAPIPIRQPWEARAAA